ncbi:hypothetical protein WN51_08322 [Melipona quadrifasciata]|uniref:Uncharacterized protein n=1 Tax=Melipona quadrifasciata TaxID=166423 RepID=A0A0M9AB09_9HYME|nr:hypothetical protein WN51_08322 [Melipona quadrifasciata]
MFRNAMSTNFIPRVLYLKLSNEMTHSDIKLNNEKKQSLKIGVLAFPLQLGTTKFAALVEFYVPRILRSYVYVVCTA